MIQSSENIALIENAFRKYQRTVSAYIFRSINDYDEAADMTQDIFLRIMERSEIIRGETLGNLITTIARHKIYEYYSRKNRERNVYGFDIDGLTSASYNADEHIKVENIRYVESVAINRLSKKQRKIYSLSRFKGMSTNEISQLMDENYKNVVNQLCLCRRDIKELIRKHCV